jgi:hypothetical protein
VMPMEKSYMDIQAAELPLQVSNFWWVWVKRWIILLCDECAMFVCIHKVLCVSVWSFVFVLFFFFCISSIKDTLHFALSCISFQ